MCMSPGCTGNKSSSKSNSYTPKKMSSAKSKAPSSPRGGFRASGFGQPKVRVSFSGRGR